MAKRVMSILKWMVVLAVGLIFLFPLLWMLRGSFLPDDEVIRQIESVSDFLPTSVNFDNYVDVFQRVDFLNTLFVSLAFCSVVMAVGLLINSACGYAFARLDFAGRDILFGVVVALVIIPFEAIAVPLFTFLGVKCQLINTLPGLFLPYLAKAFNIYFLRQYFLSFPRELEEAAKVEGASWYRIFFQVALPTAGPALATCAVLDFTIHWSEYLWPLIMTNRPEYETVQVGLGHFYTLPPIQWGDIMAYSVMATIPIMLVFVFCQRYMVLSFTTSGLKG